jgi:hypothetical protein
MSGGGKGRSMSAAPSLRRYQVEGVAAIRAALAQCRRRPRSVQRGPAVADLERPARRRSDASGGAARRSLRRPNKKYPSAGETSGRDVVS